MTDQATTATAQTDTEAGTAPSGDTSALDGLYTKTPTAESSQTETPDGGTPPEGETGEQSADTTDQGTPGEQAGKEGDQPAEIQDFTMPEGVALDEDLSGELKAFAQENNLSQEQAQKVADMGVKMLQKQQTAFEGMKTQWAEDARADREIGGERFDANLAQANKALQSFATPEYIDFLQQTGLGNHPEMIRAWYKVSQAVSEDKILTGSAAEGVADKTHEQVLFPEMN